MWDCGYSMWLDVLGVLCCFVLLFVFLCLLLSSFLHHLLLTCIHVHEITPSSPPTLPSHSPHLSLSCRVLTAGAARQAALAWSLVLREAHSLPSAMWYLHLAAVESRMMVHATCSVGSNPGSPLTTTGCQKYTCNYACTCSSAGRALCLECRVSWVRVPPEAAHFSLEK